MYVSSRRCQQRARNRVPVRRRFATLLLINACLTLTCARLPGLDEAAVGTRARDQPAVRESPDDHSRDDSHAVTVPYAGRKTIPLHAQAEASRSITIKFWQLPDAPVLVGDALAAWCQQNHGAMAAPTQDAAKRKAVRNCEAAGRRIAQAARCAVEDPQGDGSDSDCQGTPQVHSLRCTPAESGSQGCHWSATLLHNGLHRVCVDRRKGCKYAWRRKLIIQCTVTARAAAEGTLELTCDRYAQPDIKKATPRPIEAARGTNPKDHSD